MFIKNLRTLQQYNAHLTVHDSWADPAIAKHEYGVELQSDLPQEDFDAVILAVAQDEFRNLDINQITNGVSIVYDVKGILPEVIIDGKL